MQKNVRWHAGLSDGTNVEEGDAGYEACEGEISPWRRLVAHCEARNLKVTSLSLRSGKLAWTLPSASSSPKFREFAGARKPVSFRHFAKVGRDVIGGNPAEQRLEVVEAAYDDGSKLQIWVDAKTNNSWTLSL